MNLRRRQAMWGYIFLMPALVLFLFIVLYPMLRAFQFSFFRWPLGVPEKTFLGVGNYRELLTNDPLFVRSVRNTLLFTVGSVVPTLGLGLGVALLLNRQGLRWRGTLRTAFFIPVVCSLVAVSFVWRWLLEPSFGMVNSLLRIVGIDGPGWLADPSWALPAIMLVSVWRDLGYYMVIFLAGLQTIPRELNEAARVDGAGPWQGFWRITLPLLNPSIVLAAVVGVISGLQLFTQVYVMTGSPDQLPGGPSNSTRSIVLHIVQSAFRPLEMGYAAAAGFILFVMIMVVTLVQMKVIQRQFEY